MEVAAEIRISYHGEYLIGIGDITEIRGIIESGIYARNQGYMTEKWDICPESEIYDRNLSFMPEDRDIIEK